MANSVYAPIEWCSCPSGFVITFVVPSKGGCNLRCGFCLINQRQEISTDSLQPDDYVRFLREAAELGVRATAIQGYEPLLPQSMPYTRVILAEARELSIPASVVTNGVFLRQAAPELAELQVKRVGVSLDSASAERHDRIRGVRGAWLESVTGIKCALKQFASHQAELEVISVLLPGRARYLQEMPALLRELGLRIWIVNPLMQIGTRSAGSFRDRADQITADLCELHDAAREHEINLIVDDEFELLGEASSNGGDIRGGRLRIRAVPRTMTVARITPSGQCSFGTDIARVVRPTSPRWAPAKIHAAEFLRSSAAHYESMERAA